MGEKFKPPAGRAAALCALFLIIIPILLAALFGGCSKKDKKAVVYLVVAYPDPGGKSGARPVKVSVRINDQEVASKRVINPGSTISLEKKMPPGDYTVKLKESTTGASAQTLFTVNERIYMIARFHRAGKNFGYFETRSSQNPFSDKEKKEDKKGWGGGSKKADDMDDKFKELEKKRKEDKKKKADKNGTEK